MVPFPDDDEWNREARNETGTERLDRNWADLLQELRVAQTGVQLLTGLLLTIPFQARFADLVPYQRAVYLTTTGLSVLATGLLIAPVILHRVLFRRHARLELVSAGQRFAITGLATLGFAIIGVVHLIFDVVVGLIAGILAAVVALLVLAALWVVLPVVIRRRVAADDP